MRTSFFALAGMLYGCGEQKFTAVNAEPDVTISTHSHGDAVGELTRQVFLAVVDDADDEEEELIATWTAGERTICSEEPVTFSGDTICEMRLGLRESEVTVIVRDPRGSSGADSVRLEIEPTDSPVVDILSPDEVGPYYVDHAVFLEASIADGEDLPEDIVTSWESDIQGPLDVPTAPDSDGLLRAYEALTEGVHNLRLTAEDTSGKVGEDIVQITVGGPNQPPDCSFVEPESGVVVTTDSPLLLSGIASDLNVPSDRLTVVWSSDRDGELATSVPQTDGTTSVTVSDLSTSPHTLRMVVSDEVGATCTAEKVVIVTTRPAVSIVAPVGDELYYEDHAVVLDGEIIDAEDGPGALLAGWASDVDGVLAVDSDVDSDGHSRAHIVLSAGHHVLTLTGTDADGQTGSDTSAIFVRGPNQIPTCELLSPVDGAGGDEGASVELVGTVDDADIGPEALEVVWSSDIDGELGASTSDSDGAVSMSTGSLTVGTHTISLIVSDEVGARCVDNTRYIVGRAPEVSISTPGDGETVNAGETVTFLGLATDSDESAFALHVVWASDRDGTLFEGSPESAGLTRFTSDALTVGTHTITLTATDTLGLYTSDAHVVTVNGLPTTPVVRITPEPAKTTDTLAVAMDVLSVDIEGDPITYRYEWFRDGVLVGTAGTVDPSETAKHQVWEVRVTPGDGYGEGVGGTATRVISNTVPIISSVYIQPSPLYTDDSAISEIDVVDADGDDLLFSHEWWVDGVPAGSTDGSLDGRIWFDKHQLIELTVTPRDDDGEGLPVVASPVFVVNSPPTAPVVEIEPEAPVGNRDDLVCTVAEPSTDADGDSIFYSLEWTRDGDDYPSVAPEDTGLVWLGPLTDDLTDDTVPAADTVPEEEWVCSMTSWDSETSGGIGVDSVTTENPPPGCGDGIVQEGEEFDPPPGPFLSVFVDEETCRWDFSEVEQLYCYGMCSWAGPPGCDSADADVLCKLIMDNPESEALSYTTTAALSEPGFPGVYCDYGERIYTDRGVLDVAWMDSSLALSHGAGQVVAFPVCTDP